MLDISCGNICFVLCGFTGYVEYVGSRVNAGNLSHRARAQPEPSRAEAASSRLLVKALEM